MASRAIYHLCVEPKDLELAKKMIEYYSGSFNSVIDVVSIIENKDLIDGIENIEAGS